MPFPGRLLSKNHMCPNRFESGKLSSNKSSRQSRKSPAAAALGVLAGAVVVPRAVAQVPSPLAEWQYTAGIPLEKMFERAPRTWRVDLGVGAAVRPVYPGDDRYRMMAGPSVSIRYRDRVFVSTGEGLGVDVVDTRHLQIGVALGYSLGRQQSGDAFHLRGLGDIPVSASALVFANYVVSKDFPLVLRAAARRDIGGTDGWSGTFSVYMPLPGSSKRFHWFAGPTLTVGDARYMRRWFGVTAAQAARSPYGVYDAHAGLKSYGAGLSAMWFMRKHWFLDVDAAVEALVNGAGHSPITQQPATAAVDATVTYQF